jgi:FkbM family methyltransferase
MSMEYKLVKINNLPFDCSFSFAIPLDDIYIPGKNVQTYIDRYGCWASEESLCMYTVLANIKNSTVIDIGSNTGYFACLALSLNATNVIAVEPNKIHNIYFNKSIEQFDTNKVKYYNLFVSNKTNKVKFNGWSGNDYIIEKSNDESYLIETITLNQLAPNGATFTKIDVEGEELSVLLSAGSKLKSGIFPYIMFEVTIIKNNDDHITMLNYLKNCGYLIFKIGVMNDQKKFLSRLSSSDFKMEYTLELSGYNAFAIHNSKKDISDKLFNNYIIN